MDTYRRYWRINFTVNGFQAPLFVHGTEEETRAYVESEVAPHVDSYRYHGASSAEVAHAKILGVKMYLASTLPEKGCVG